jgi:hypothetical protein
MDLNAWKRTGLFGSHVLPGRFMFGGRRMGQAPDWKERAWKAVDGYDTLVARAAGISDDAARSSILGWVGRTNVPGSPAERYNVVVADLAGMPEPEMAMKRTEDLEDVVAEFETMVENALSSFGTIPKPSAGGVVSPEGGLTTKGVIVGAVAVLGLIVLPLALE